MRSTTGFGKSGKRRVLFVNHTLSKSGASISLGTLIDALLEEVEPVLLLRTRSVVDQVLGSERFRTYHARYLSQFLATTYSGTLPLPVFVWQLIKAPFAAVRVVWLCYKWKVDLVHVNETTLPMDALGGWLAGCPVVIHSRTALSPERHFERRILAWVAALRGVRFIAIDEEVKRSLPPSCRSKCSVVFNPVKIESQGTPAAVHELRKSWGFCRGDVVVGQVASLHLQKGVLEVLKMAETICRQIPNARFVFVGDDGLGAGEGPQMRAAIDRMGLQKQIILAGYRRDLSVVYGALDIALCLFATLQGVGRTAFEAAMMGKPMVAMLPDPASNETLTDERDALVCRSGDWPAAEKAVIRLIQDPGLRNVLGQNALRYIAPRHFPETSAKSVLDIYRLAGLER